MILTHFVGFCGTEIKPSLYFQFSQEAEFSSRNAKKRKILKTEILSNILEGQLKRLSVNDAMFFQINPACISGNRRQLDHRGGDKTDTQRREY